MIEAQSIPYVAPCRPSKFGKTKRQMIVELFKLGNSRERTAELANASPNYVSTVLSDFDLLEKTRSRKEPLPEPNPDADMIARRAHVERMKALFLKAAGLSHDQHDCGS